MTHEKPSWLARGDISEIFGIPTENFDMRCEISYLMPLMKTLKELPFILKNGTREYNLEYTTDREGTLELQMESFKDIKVILPEENKPHPYHGVNGISSKDDHKVIEVIPGQGLEAPIIKYIVLTQKSN